VLLPLSANFRCPARLGLDGERFSPPPEDFPPPFPPPQKPPYCVFSDVVPVLQVPLSVYQPNPPLLPPRVVFGFVLLRFFFFSFLRPQSTPFVAGSFLGGWPPRNHFDPLRSFSIAHPGRFFLLAHTDRPAFFPLQRDVRNLDPPPPALRS